MSHRKPAHLRVGHRTKAEIAAQEARAAKKAAAAAPLFPGTSEEAAANPLGAAPANLSPEAREAWELVAPALQRVNLLSAADSIALGRYCGWLAHYFEMTKSARKTKVVQITKSRAGKMQRIDRNFQALLLLDKRLVEYEDRLGMNPRARQAIFARLATGFTAPPAKAPAAEERRSPIGFLNTRAKRPH